jgi:hypothetical protein
MALTREALLAHLREVWLEGPHGTSELRAVAEFVLDAMDGNEDGPSAVDLCDSLAEACETVRQDLDALTADEPETVCERLRRRIEEAVYSENVDVDEEMKVWLDAVCAGVADTVESEMQAQAEDRDMLCEACGQPMVVNQDGTTNHLLPADATGPDATGVGPIDHDADADHVALAPEEDEP